MAVVLCRSDGKNFPASPDLPRNAPRVLVKNEPLPIPSHKGKKIAARSKTHYACAEPEREEVWRDSFERRKVQLSNCGFHGPAHHPYRDVGGVELDDRRLILTGLGQQDGTERPPSSPSPERSTLPPLLPPGGGGAVKVKLRAKTASQFPMELASLEGELGEVKGRVALVTRGQSLFKIMRDTHRTKQEAAERETLLETDAERNEWREALVSSQFSLHDDGTVLPWQQEDPAPHSGERMSMSSRSGQAEAQEAPHEHNREEEEGQSHDQTDDVIDRWYRQLCVLVWVLEAMRMDSPAHMPPLGQCWRLNRASPDEGVGRRVADRNRTLLQQWEGITQGKKKPILRHKFPPAAQRRVTQQQTPQPLSLPRSISVTPQMATPTRDHVNMSHDPRLHPPTPKPQAKERRQLNKTRELSWAEEQRMRRQKKLTSAQMQGLLTMLEEELSYSKKQSRSRIKALLRDADQARLQSEVARSPPKTVEAPAVSLDVEEVSRKFSEAEEGRKMIVHEQLTAMERDCQQALEQRFSSLQVSGNLWRDLAVMREGVEIESTAMARRRLLMNYDWYLELLSLLPPEVKADRYCQQLLDSLSDLASYMVVVGPSRMSKRRLIQVLGTLRPWELHSPEIASAVQFLITRVIYIVVEDYEKWLEQHTLTCQAKRSISPNRT